MTMTITLNGESKEITPGLSAEKLLEEAGYQNMLVAIAINGNFVPRNAYQDTAIQNGDEIEIVSPMQGG